MKTFNINYSICIFELWLLNIVQRREVKLDKNPGKNIFRKKSAATGECVAALYTNQKPK
jgi:hypothetical protein